MAQFSFELFMPERSGESELQADEFLDSVEDSLFEAFDGDVTPGMMGGVPVLYCTREGQSLGEVLDEITASIVKMGLHPVQLLIKMSPEAPQQFA